VRTAPHHAANVLSPTAGGYLPDVTGPHRSAPEFTPGGRSRQSFAGEGRRAVHQTCESTYRPLGGCIGAYTPQPMAACANCGTENPKRAKFCLECGSPFAAEQSGMRESRRTVTVLFSDIVGSTDLGEQLDPEAVWQVMTRYFSTMQGVIEGHGGTVEKFIGDAIMAVFGLPQVHEDDALRAVRAAAEMREALADLNAQLRGERGVEIAARTGINTGEVLAADPGSRQTLVTGDAVNTAARLREEGEPPAGRPVARATDGDRERARAPR